MLTCAVNCYSSGGREYHHLLRYKRVSRVYEKVQIISRAQSRQSGARLTPQAFQSCSYRFGMCDWLVVERVTSCDLAIKVQVTKCDRYHRALLVNARDVVRKRRSVLLIHVAKLGFSETVRTTV